MKITRRYSSNFYFHCIIKWASSYKVHQRCRRWNFVFRNKLSWSWSKSLSGERASKDISGPTVENELQSRHQMILSIFVLGLVFPTCFVLALPFSFTAVILHCSCRFRCSEKSLLTDLPLSQNNGRKLYSTENDKIRCILNILLLLWSSRKQKGENTFPIAKGRAARTLFSRVLASALLEFCCFIRMRSLTRHVRSVFLFATTEWTAFGSDSRDYKTWL